MITLENNHLRINIRPQGAELTSIFYKPTHTEHLWQADPTVWGWHAPNLFPIVGGLLNNQLLIDSQTYPLNRHGFARQSLFTVAELSTTRAVLSLSDSSETRAVYPYGFLFQLIYDLTDTSLSLTYRVQNTGSIPLFFSVGAHPAFAVPFTPTEAYRDYYLEFTQPEALLTHQLSGEGLFTGETRTIPTDGNRLPLTEHLFDQDALVFKNLASCSVALKSKNHQRAVTVSFPDFPYLGIWAKPGAPFVCIEPWLGCADSVGNPKPIEQKEAIQQVAVGGDFSATFSISIS